MNRKTLQLFCAAALPGLPLAAAAHMLDGSPDPLPHWVPIAGLIIAGVMGGAVGFAINKHRQSIEQKRKQQHTARAESSAVTESQPPESAR